MAPAATNVVPLTSLMDEAQREHLERVRAEDSDAYPRDARNRFRIYRLIARDLQILTTVETREAIGVALCTLHEDGEFESAAVGVLDTRGAPRGSGVWIVNPYEAGRR
jgi:hypothetical protein